MTVGSVMVLALTGACQRGEQTQEEIGALGEAPMRRLTRTEYNNTVYQLLGDPSQPAWAFTPDEEVNGYDNQAAAQTVSVLLAEQYQAAAEELALDNLATLFELAPACVSGTPAACDADAAAFVESFGLLAFRRPLAADEKERYTGLFATGTALGEGAYDGGAGLRLVVEAMLQSPYFLYRVEHGEPAAAGTAAPLTSYEVASRLSYTIWGSMPDDQLFDAAAQDLLQDPAEIEFQARRLLSVPRARGLVKHFVGMWLGLDDVVSYVGAVGKDTTVYPDYRPSLLPLFVDETSYFLENLIFDEEASIMDMFTAPYTMANAELAQFYGLDPGDLGETFERVDLDPVRYAGVLSQPGLLALHASTNNTSPTHRGLFVRESFFCQPPPPMPEVIPPAPTVDPDVSTREQYEQHATDPACAGCHTFMDPVGFGFESFDALGHYRAEQSGAAIDASGYIIATSDSNGDFDGVQDLGQILASSDQVADCISSQWFTFAFGRAESPVDAATLAEMRAPFAASDYDLRELMIATTQTAAFRYKTATTEEAR